MKKTVLFVLLEQFADWEHAFLSTALQDRIQDQTSPYEVKTVSLVKQPVKSIGGLTVLPDYSVEDCPTDYAGLVLIGGYSWRKPEVSAVFPLVKGAVTGGKVVGAICDATVFLGMHGLLNEGKHTGNTLEDLIGGAGDAYCGREHYLSQQAVRDGNLITANGSAHLEFTREVLTALNAYPADLIEGNYQFFKQGYIELMKHAPSEF